jgi:hypothetical protein
VVGRTIFSRDATSLISPSPLVVLSADIASPR